MTKDELYAKYPHLFAKRLLGKSQSCMARGIEVGDGWFGLIDKMSAELINAAPEIQYEQIKEKFGTLRVYTDGITDDTKKAVRFIIAKYEDISLTVCETCGEDGALRMGDWRSVSCEEHNVGNIPASDTRLRWTPDNHPSELKGILAENLADGHLANVIKFMEKGPYSRYHVSLFSAEAVRRGLTPEFISQEHPFTDEYEIVGGEHVSKK